MKNLYIYIIFFKAIFFFNCWGQQNKTEIIHQSNLVYHPIKEISGRFCAEVSINGSLKEFLILDSGMSSGLIMLDSAYFYDNIYNNELELLDIDYNMIYYQKFYKGLLSVEVSNNNFMTEFAKIEVNTRFQELNKIRNPKLMGMLGVDIFSEKITIINFKDSLIAISDTLIVDFDLKDFVIVNLERAREIKKGNKDWRYLKFEGFITKDNKVKNGLFLLDTGNSRNEMVMKSSFGKDLQYDKKETLISGYNMGAEDWLWKSDTLILGNIFKTHNVEIAISKLPESHDWVEGLSGGDGLIGLTFLKKFDIVILDYKNDKLYLKVY